MTEQEEKCVPPTETYISLSKKSVKGSFWRCDRCINTAATDVDKIFCSKWQVSQVHDSFLPVHYEALLTVSASTFQLWNNDDALSLSATLIKTNWYCYLKGSSLPWDKQRRFVSIRNANMTNTFIHRYKSNADLFSLHIQTHFWWGNSIWKVFLTVWIHVDRHTWWASKFLQSQNFLSGSLAWSSTSLHIKHSDVSVEEEERICLINNASQVKIHFLKEWPLQISTFIPQLISHCSIQHAVQLPRALDLDFVPSGSEAKWIWALKVIVAGWHFWQDNKHGAEVSDSKK